MIEITYYFTFPDTKDRIIEFRIKLDDTKLNLIPTDNLNEIDDKKFNDEWTKLDFKQCSNCPLKAKEHPYCPVAKNINMLVNVFKETASYTKSKMYVETLERTYIREGSVQEGLFSIFGIIMATSGCPHLNFLRPLARFHLPFSSSEETLFRITSTFLLKKFIQKQMSNEKNAKDLLSLDELSDLYKEVGVVNRDFLNRIRAVVIGDANQNAMVVLNCFAQLIESEIGAQFESLYYLFPQDS